MVLSSATYCIIYGPGIVSDCIFGALKVITKTILGTGNQEIQNSFLILSTTSRSHEVMQASMMCDWFDSLSCSCNKQWCSQSSAITWALGGTGAYPRKFRNFRCSEVHSRAF